MKYDLNKTTLPNYDITLELSNKFSQILYKSLGERIVKKIVELNKIETKYCASHKFCDSNEFMIDALNYLFGDKWNVSDERITNLINDSWELSIINEFKKGLK